MWQLCLIVYLHLVEGQRVLGRGGLRRIDGRHLQNPKPQCDICGRGEELTSPNVNIWDAIHRKGHAQLLTSEHFDQEAQIATCQDLDDYLVQVGNCKLQFEYRDVCTCARGGGGNHRGDDNDGVGGNNNRGDGTKRGSNKGTNNDGGGNHSGDDNDGEGGNNNRGDGNKRGSNKGTNNGGGGNHRGDDNDGVGGNNNRGDGNKRGSNKGTNNGGGGNHRGDDNGVGGNNNRGDGNKRGSKGTNNGGGRKGRGKGRNNGKSKGGRGKGRGSNSEYAGADTEREKKLLQWLPRVSGVLSVFGSSLILRDILFATPHGRIYNSMYHQLIAGMSVFDIIGSISWILSTLMLPTDATNDVSGARGNDTTCKIQGFMLQLSFTGVLYFVSLTFYYLLTIRFRVRESRVKKWKWAFHVPPVLAGLLLALIALPDYESLNIICHLRTPDLVRSHQQRYIILVSVIPLGIAFVVSLLTMMVTYLYVRQTDRASNRWRMSVQANNSSPSASTWQQSNDNSFTSAPSAEARIPARRSATATSGRLTNAVFWQFSLYVLSFILTWGMYFVSSAGQATGRRYSYWVPLLVLTPLQGFWNAVVYFRPQLAQGWERRRKHRRLMAEQQTRKKQADIIAVEEPRPEAPLPKDDNNDNNNNINDNNINGNNNNRSNDDHNCDMEPPLSSSPVVSDEEDQQVDNETADKVADSNEMLDPELLSATIISQTEERPEVQKKMMMIPEESSTMTITQTEERPEVQKEGESSTHFGSHGTLQTESSNGTINAECIVMN